jgi:hypothetical protein
MTKVMRAVSLSLIVTALFAASCTRTHNVKRPATVAELQLSMMRRDSGVVTPIVQAPATPPAASPLPPAPVAWGTELTADGQIPLVDLSAIRGYEVKRRFVGGVEGLLIGAGIGAFTGAALAASQVEDSSCDGQDHCVDLFSEADIIAFSAILAGLTGAAVGALVGAFRGHTDRYVW